jgi:3-oxoacyl-[acyl-carrier protein] reductase
MTSRMSQTMLLKTKTAVVTGCLQGIGRATLDLFAAHGANVFACAQAPSDEFSSHCAELARLRGVQIMPLYFDLLDDGAVKQAALAIQKMGMPVDALVNVAGVNKDALFHMVTMEQLRLTFQINLFSQIAFTQYITRIMLRHKKGSVINIASITGIDGNPGQLAYAASKAAVIAATKTMSAELGPQGIRVNAVAPGVIATAMTAAVPSEALSRLLARSKLARIGEPAEVAKVCLYLASDRASFVTGQVVRVDGGIG